MPPTKHAEHGASGSKRWMNCAGSIWAQRGLPDPSSIYAAEGTAAHELAETCLQERVAPEEFLGHTISVEEEDKTYEIEVTEEMIDAVQEYVDHIHERLRILREDHGEVEMFIEHQFDLSKLGPPAPMYGTSDCTLWVPSVRHIETIDLKYGQGVQVDADDNSQLRMYALGAVVEIGKAPRSIRTTIVQPRGGGETIKTDDLTYEDLVAFKKELFEAAERTLDPDAEKAPGDWCRFCRASATCEARQEQALAVVQASFTDVKLEEGQGDGDDELPAPQYMDDERLSFVMANMDQIIKWFADVKDHVQRRVMEDPDAFPEWKVVASRKHRRWKDEEHVDKYLRNRGLRVDERAPRKLISPSQAEKALKKLKKGPPLPEDLYETPEGSPTLAPADDTRPALRPAAPEAFDDASAPTNTEEK